MNTKSFTNYVKSQLRKGMTPIQSAKTEWSNVKSQHNISKLASKYGIVPGAHYGQRIKYAENLFAQGKAKEAREYLKLEGQKIRQLNKK